MYPKRKELILFKIRIGEKAFNSNDYFDPINKLAKKSSHFHLKDYINFKLGVTSLKTLQVLDGKQRM